MSFDNPEIITDDPKVTNVNVGSPLDNANPDSATRSWPGYVSSAPQAAPPAPPQGALPAATSAAPMPAAAPTQAAIPAAAPPRPQAPPMSNPMAEYMQALNQYQAVLDQQSKAGSQIPWFQMAQGFLLSLIHI